MTAPTIKQFKAPDLNAPRYRMESYNPLDRAFFRALRLAHPQFKDYTDTVIRRIIKTTNEAIVEKIIDSRDGVELPEFLGYMFIGTCNRKGGVNYDYKRSAEYGQLVQHRNFESDNYLEKIFYTNYETKYRFKFHELWSFSACRNFTRQASAAYIKDWKKYIAVEPNLRISRLYRKSKAKQAQKIKTEIQLKDYDEFSGL